MVQLTLQNSRGVSSLENSESPQRILAALIHLLALEIDHGSSEDMERLHQHLNSATTEALRLVSASTMLLTCLQLLHSNDVALQVELYNLLGSAILQVNADARGQLSSDIVLMIKTIKEALSTSKSTKLFLSAYRALQAIAKSAHAAELSALTQTIPTVTANLQATQLSEPGIQTLHVLW